MKPREKILHSGPKRLLSKELIAIILGSGIAGQDVFQLSKKVDAMLQHKWVDISIDDMLSISGIWKIKAMQIVAGLELAKRYFINDSIVITSIVDILWEVWEYRNKKQEYFITLSLDGANRIISKRIISIWTLNQSLVHPREVFAPALEERANSIILVHNHPSWTVYPSPQDISVTARLLESAQILGVEILDHVIITNKEHYSFKENGDF